MAQQSINITIPPGPLGVGIVSEDGNCIISSKSNQSNSPLMVDDIIISLNGIKLSQIEGGVDGWVRLFQMFGQVQRNLVVQRDITNNSSSMTNGALKDSTNHDSSPMKKQKVMKQEKKTSTNNKLSTGMEVISLLSDDEDEEYDTLGKKSGGAAAATASRGSNKNVLDRDVLEVPMAPAWRNASSDTASSRGNLKDDNNYNNSGGKKKSNDVDEDDDEELTVIATKGSNALADFPHSRENCVTHPFSGDKKLHCSNCYCYVCDKSAKDCAIWASHCSASHSDPRWRRKRELAKRRARELEAAPVQPPPAAAARPLVVRAPSAHQLSRTRRSADFSISKLLSEITTVHPVEMQPPSGRGFSTSLRHYQKQSLAFMVETERTHNRGGWLSDEVGMGKTAVTLALVATNQPAPNGLATSQQIAARCNQYNKNIDTRQQINADFNMQVATLRETFGLGYGIDPAIQQQFDAKRSVLLQVKANRLAAIPALPTKKLKIKTTVIMTSVSLIGQWEDEVRKPLVLYHDASCDVSR